jgi:hypothetical protein
MATLWARDEAARQGRRMVETVWGIPMNSKHTPEVVTSNHVLLKAAMADLEKAADKAQPGDKVNLIANQWQETYILTQRYGWLRLPN